MYTVHIHFCPQFFQGIAIVINIINLEGGLIQLNLLNVNPSGYGPGCACVTVPSRNQIQILFQFQFFLAVMHSRHFYVHLNGLISILGGLSHVNEEMDNAAAKKMHFIQVMLFCP